VYFVLPAARDWRPVLEAVDEKTRKSSRIVRRALQVDRDSLKDAQIQAGVVL